MLVYATDLEIKIVYLNKPVHSLENVQQSQQTEHQQGQQSQPTEPPQQQFYTRSFQAHDTEATCLAVNGNMLATTSFDCVVKGKYS
jgi:hypothetical protein